MKTQRWLKKALVLNVISLGLIISVSGVFAQMVKAPLEDIARNSHTIVRGTVTEKWSEYEKDGKNIVTFIKIDVSRSIKGRTIGSDTLVIPGGIVGDVGIEVSHTPHFKLEEEVVVFISDDYKNRGTVTGWRQGKFTVINNHVFYNSKEFYVEEFVNAVSKFVRSGEVGSIELENINQNNQHNGNSDAMGKSTQTTPTIFNIDPNNGPALRPYAIDPDDPFDPGERGTVIDIYGSNFGSSQGSGVVRFYENSGTPAEAEDYLIWNNSHIRCKVPGQQWNGENFLNASSGAVYVVNSEGVSDGVQFDVSFATNNKRFSNPSVTFYVNQNGTPDASNEFTAIQNALQTWSNVNHAILSFQYGGTTSRTPTIQDGYNDIGWIENNNWPFNNSLAHAVNFTIFDGSENSNTLYESDIYDSVDLIRKTL